MLVILKLKGGFERTFYKMTDIHKIVRAHASDVHTVRNAKSSQKTTLFLNYRDTGSDWMLFALFLQWEVT